MYAASQERGPYWYFRYHDGGKQEKLYLGKTDDLEGEPERRRRWTMGKFYDCSTPYRRSTRSQVRVQ
jgi:hypothetical protein